MESLPIEKYALKGYHDICSIYLNYEYANINSIDILTVNGHLTESTLSECKNGNVERFRDCK